ncbi:MAG: MBL fold metallo-hydrolase [Firmicutes bacterium]|nr:MBL fold metallo-hydrolase [Bacillota bacterium]
MKIKFLGTAAAEGMPALFCNCITCEKARKMAGKNIRTRSQILVNDNILLDFPPDSYFHAITNNLDFSKIKYLFITHAHPDHCIPTEFALRVAPHAHRLKEPLLHIYGNQTVIESIKACIPSEKQHGIKLQKMTPFQQVKIAGITVTALPAEHEKNTHETDRERCFIYLLEDGKNTFLQFHDSGILPDAVYTYLKSRKVKIDCIAFDCTFGFIKKGPARHMGYFDTVEEKERMNKFGILNPHCKYILTHFSHNCGLLHLEMETKVENDKKGFLVAYDGMEIILGK